VYYLNEWTFLAPKNKLRATRRIGISCLREEFGWRNGFQHLGTSNLRQVAIDRAAAFDTDGDGIISLTEFEETRFV